MDCESRLRTSPRRLLVLLAAALLALLAVPPVAAYVIVLKDGTQMTVRNKPQIRDGRAYFTLASGTDSFLPAEEIDLARTEQANVVDYGTARVIEGVGSSAPPPSLPEEGATLTDLARRGSLARPEARRREEPNTALGPLPRTGAGFVDLMEVQRLEHRDSEMVGALVQFLRGAGYERLGVFQGTTSDRVLLELTANSEAAVFKGVSDAARALEVLRERFGDRVGAVELTMATSTEERRSRAAQFVLTLELAALLTGGEMDADDFFMAYVQF